ncbi:putative late blight resistance protein homolog R1A-10 [Salvia miltiorrhiza]|uniref:putative late blight resistance protein homolog R1A-10 n=1 Tax=Salvia miltiorrhiza TaxID=226208 RepID=UPI0025AC54E8|nr:putative late blight resistance protein homolog R1A-10 [Salvia miltiorrhiza]
MAYNLQSLITILQGILDPQQTRWILGREKPQLQSLLEKASSLQQILEKTPLTKIPSLESRIRDVANEAEDIIESHMVERMLSIPKRVNSILQLTPDVLLVTQKLDSVIEQVVKLVEVERNMKPTGSSWSGASFSSSKSVVVGVDEDLMQLKDRLTEMQTKLEIVPIVGMGGIGKTTLARTLYQDPLIVDHFSYLAWTTISQDYNMRSILLSLIQCIIGKEECDKHNGKGNGELKDILYRSLYGRRYMIVLDDIWSTTFWDEIRRYFPDNNNRSRIVITTRESDVAKYADSKSLLHKVQLLNEPQSWDLLSQIVFGEEYWPHELQGIGEKIASDCGGLPLAINVIGGLLSKVERLKGVWENIGNDVRAAIGESDKQFSNILSLSYNHLPIHLKPCFLYMVAFPEDYEIDPLRLIWMWVAEGFVKSNGDKSLEEEAEDYLKSLVERNLFSVITSYHWYGKETRYNMHDLLRDLCIRKADDGKFLHVKNSTFCNQLRRVSIHTSYGMEDDEYASSEILVRSFLLFVELDRNVLPMVSTLSLLRVLDLLEMNKYHIKIEFPEEILQLVNLRYLTINCKSLPRSGISRLSNLQTLIALLGDGSCPADLWEMSELRHLIILGTFLRIEDDYMKKIVLKKLQTIRNVYLTLSVIRRGFLESIPNIKSLGIAYKVEGSSWKMSEVVVDLSHLHKLQTLSWVSSQYLHVPKFPSTLRELTLEFCVITLAVTTALCALPNLEVLNMHKCSFKSNETEEEEANEEWEIAEGDEFSSLHFLLLEDCISLVRWRADETNFPRLRHLYIRKCPYLEEIPAGIGEIPTLQLIFLEYCSDSAEASAKQIQEEQVFEYENYDLQLIICRYDD